MATETPVRDGHQNREEPQLDKEISALSLSSKTVHADDFLNSGQDVAPPMHVSTTFRYSNNPDNLVPWVEHKVCLPVKSGRYKSADYYGS